MIELELLMRHILCFGDSNTWGYVPGTGARYDDKTRWTKLTEQMLNNEFTLFEAGLSGRTINSEDPLREYRNGSQLLNLYLESTRPLDLVIIMLGTNDLKASLANTIDDIAANIKALCQQAINFDYSPYQRPKVMLVAPVPFVNSVALEQDFINEITRSKQLSPAYFHIAQALNIDFLDAGRVIKASNIDGIHWDADGHRDFANHLSALLKSK